VARAHSGVLRHVPRSVTEDLCLAVSRGD